MIPRIFDRFRGFEIGNIIISEDGTHHIFPDGRPLYDKRFRNVLSFHPPGVAAVIDDSGAYHILPDGSELYSHRYIRTFGFYDYRAAVVDKNGWYHIDLEGKKIYKETYSWVGNYQEGLCTVRDRNGRFFHIDTDGNPIYKEKYAYAGDFRYGYAVVHTEEGYAYHIDRLGKKIYSLRFRDLDVFHKGFARAVAEDGGWFHIRKDGSPLYPQRYKYIEPFYNGLARVIGFDGRIGRIDENGDLKEILYDPADNVRYFISRLQKLAICYWELQTVIAAIKLGIFEILEKHPSDIGELAKEIGIKYEHCRILLKALEVKGYIMYKNGSGYILTRLGRILCGSHPKSMKYPLLIYGEEHYLTWNDLADFLKFAAENPDKNISAFEKRYGLPFFEWLEHKPHKARIYHKGIAFYAENDYDPLIKNGLLKFHPIIADIGGGLGILLKKYLKKYPESRGILFDTPLTVKYAREYWGDFIDRKRIGFVPGNFFENVDDIPSVYGEKPDALILSRVLHDWNDIDAVKILVNCKNIIKDSGTIYVISLIVPDDPKIDLGVYLTLNMILMTGGKERTLDDYKSLIKRAGLQLKKFTCTGLLSVLEIGK